MKTNKKQSLIWWDKRLFFIIIDIAFLYTDWYNVFKENADSREAIMDNRELIVQSALELFYARGYDAVGVQEIVDKAGISKPTLYYYFGSKLGLLKVLLEGGYENLESRLLPVIDQGGDIKDVLYRTAREFFDYCAGHQKFYLFMLSLFYLGRENEAYVTVGPVIQRFYKLIVRIFENASSQLGNMRGRQDLFAVGFTGILNHHVMTLSYNLAEGEEFYISNETTYEIVHQFMYGIYT